MNTTIFRAGAVVLVSAAIPFSMWLLPKDSKPETEVSTASAPEPTPVQQWSGMVPFEVAGTDGSIASGALWNNTGLELASVAVHADVRGRKVNLYWVPEPPLGQQVTVPFMNQNAGVSAGTSFAVRYWPTEIRYLGNNKFLIAGKDDQDDTILEQWTFSLPNVGLDDAGERMMTPGARTNVRQIRRWTDAARDMIIHMWVKAGSSTVIQAQFFGDHSVWEINTAGPQSGDTLIASPTNTPGVLYEPALDNWLPRFIGMKEHVSSGYVTGFMRDSLSGSGLQTPAGGIEYVLLLDTDKDGDYDGSLALTPAQFDAQGWNTSSNYL